MATRRKSSTQTKSGGMVSGIIIGLILGLAAAVAVALYINQAPIPFMSQGTHHPERLPNLSNAPDPNRALHNHTPSLEAPLIIGQPDLIGEQLTKLSEQTPTPVPSTTPKTATEADSLGSLIAQLPNPHSATSAAPKAAAPKVAAAPTTYYLQAGAFRSTNDAEAMRARILLLGMDVTIQSAPYEGGTINRVRVGPFAGLDQMNQARSRLGSEKIETSVVRP